VQVSRSQLGEADRRTLQSTMRRGGGCSSRQDSIPQVWAAPWRILKEGFGEAKPPKITVRAPECGRQRRPHSGARTRRFFWRAVGPPNLPITHASCVL